MAQHLDPLVFSNHAAQGGRWCRRGRNGKRQPGIPAGRASRVTKFSVTLEINVTLKALTERKHVAELRPDAEHLRLETRCANIAQTFRKQMMPSVEAIQTAKHAFEELDIGANCPPDDEAPSYTEYPASVDGERDDTPPGTQE